MSWRAPKLGLTKVGATHNFLIQCENYDKPIDKPIDFVVPNFQTNPEGILCYPDSCCGIAPDRENFGSCFSQHSAAGAANARCSARDQTNQTITTERHGKQRRKIKYTHIITHTHIYIYITYIVYIHTILYVYTYIYIYMCVCVFIYSFIYLLCIYFIYAIYMHI